MPAITPSETSPLNTAFESAQLSTSDASAEVIDFDAGSCRSMVIDDQELLDSIEQISIREHIFAKLTPNHQTQDMIMGSLACIFGPLAIGSGIGAVCGASQSLGDALLHHERAGHARSFVNNLVGGTSLGAVIAIPAALFLTAFLCAKGVKTMWNIREAAVIPNPIATAVNENSRTNDERRLDIELSNIESQTTQRREQTHTENSEPERAAQSAPGNDVDPAFILACIQCTFGTGIGTAGASVFLNLILDSLGGYILGHKSDDFNMLSAPVGFATIAAVLGFAATTGVLIHKNI